MVLHVAEALYTLIQIGLGFAMVAAWRDRSRHIAVKSLLASVVLVAAVIVVNPIAWLAYLILTGIMLIIGAGVADFFTSKSSNAYSLVQLGDLFEEFFKNLF